MLFRYNESCINSKLNCDDEHTNKTGNMVVIILCMHYKTLTHYCISKLHVKAYAQSTCSLQNAITMAIRHQCDVVAWQQRAGPRKG